MSKKDQLLEAAEQRARKREPVLEHAPRKGYRVVAVSLYLDEAEAVDQCVDKLKRAGNAKANRSLVVREALHRLMEDTGELDRTELVQYFLDRQARRTEAAMP